MSYEPHIISLACPVFTCARSGYSWTTSCLFHFNLNLRYLARKWPCFVLLVCSPVFFNFQNVFPPPCLPVLVALLSFVFWIRNTKGRVTGIWSDPPWIFPSYYCLFSGACWVSCHRSWLWLFVYKYCLCVCCWCFSCISLHSAVVTYW